MAADLVEEVVQHRAAVFVASGAASPTTSTIRTPVTLKNLTAENDTRTETTKEPIKTILTTTLLSMFLYLSKTCDLIENLIL